MSRRTRLAALLAALLAAVVAFALAGCMASAPLTLTDLGVHTFTATGTETGEHALERLTGTGLKQATITTNYVVMTSDDGQYQYLDPAESLSEAMRRAGQPLGTPETADIHVWATTDGTHYYTDPARTATQAAAYVVSDDYQRLDDTPAH